MTVQELRERIEKNAQAWHKTQDPEKRSALHQENVELYGMLDGQTGSTSEFDSVTGKWSTTDPGIKEYQAKGTYQMKDRSPEAVSAARAATESHLAALKTAKERSDAALLEEEAALDGVYGAARNQIAAQNEIQRKNTGEWAADKGLSSGAAGQVALSQSVAAQHDLAALDAQEAAAREGIARSKSQMERDYEMAIAEAKAEGDYALADALYKESVRFDEAQRQQWRDEEALYQTVWQMAQKKEAQDYDRAQEAEQTAYQRAKDAQTLERQQDKDAWDRLMDAANLDYKESQAAAAQEQRQFDNARRLAQDRAAVGDFSGYLSLGFTQSQVDTMSRLWRYWKTYKK